MLCRLGRLSAGTGFAEHSVQEQDFPYANKYDIALGSKRGDCWFG